MKMGVMTAAVVLSVLAMSGVAAADDSFHAGATVGLGVPDLVSAQALVKWKYLGAGLELGMLPTISANDVSLHSEMLDANVRLYPFKGAFFIGCGLGARSMTASINNQSFTYQGANGVGQGTMTVNTTFIDPRIGFLHRFGGGFSLGMDVALEVPIDGNVQSSVSGTVNGQQVSVAPPQKVFDAGNTVKGTVIPVVHLLQLGWMF